MRHSSHALLRRCHLPCAPSQSRRLEEAERALAARTLELDAAIQELEAFALSVSHDLRAPLRHVDGYLSLLETHLGDRLDAEGVHFLEAARQANVRMGLLVEALLSYSRLGRTGLYVQEIDAGQLVASVIEACRAEEASRPVRWQVGRLPVLHGDWTMVRQVFRNLVDNALKFSRHAVEAVIEIQAIDGLTGEAGVMIRDNGAGFNPDYSHKLFGVFQRLHREDEFEGIGIGLANVHRIVSRHGGRVWAEGSPGRGAAFFVAFPVPRA